MKTIKFISITTTAVLLSIGFMFKSCAIEFGATPIKGSKNLITKEISITDYDKIEISENVIFNYQQSDNVPFLQVTVDDNIWEYLDIRVENKILKVAPKQKENGFRSYNIHPTTFIINSNSTKLTDLNYLGSGTFNILSDIKTDKFTLILIGSGDIISEKSVFADELKITVTGSGDVSMNGKVNKCKVNVSGSGNVTCPALLSTDQLNIDMSGSGDVSFHGEVNKCKINLSGSGNVTFPTFLSVDELKISIAGSGDISLTGKANSCDINIAGSGDVGTFNCSVNDLNCSIAGSGDVKLHVENSLYCTIAGSGSLQYTGNPSIIEQTVLGSGKIIKKPQSTD